jgi:two-component SAPR family response regulator
MKTLLFKVGFLCLFLGLQKSSFGQSYGLGFSSDEVDQNKRTALDLSPQKDLCFTGNFDISFDISFLRTTKTYFGYIVRIIEDDKRNLDLIYDDDADVFKLIVGERLSKIPFCLKKNTLYKQWHKIKITFDVDNDRLVLFAGGQTYIEDGINLKKKNCYKFLFGVNAYKQFATTDVPPIKIRDISIRERNVVKHYWPLSEGGGTIAHDIIRQNDGAVTNPLWIKADHFNWKLRANFMVAGSASVAFNPSKETLYIVGRDSLFCYPVKNARVSSSVYASGQQNLSIGNQSVYSAGDSMLYNFYVDKKFVAPFSFKSKSWQRQDTAGLTAELTTDFIQLNKFISHQDTSLYILGGYGHHAYKSRVQQYHIKSHLWEDAKVQGDFFTPRYLAAVGSTAKGDTAYILGGYGSLTGQQILNAKNLYDMVRFTTRDHAFKKLFEINNRGESFAFANSLIIDEDTKTYYGLIFPQLKFDSKLQLIKGSLLNNAYKLVGNAIPYSFNDLRSFADVYYCPASKVFLAVTLLRNRNNKETQVKVYTLLGPPESLDPAPAVTAGISTYWLWIDGVLTLIIAGAIYAAWFTRKRNVKVTEPNNSAINNPLAVIHLNHVEKTNENNAAIPQKGKAQIFLFGELQLVTESGHEIVNAFTTLTKELFVYLFLHSVRWDRGVSSEKLNEILWFDKDEKSASNNRSVNMAKLKRALDQLGHYSLSKDTGYWKIEVDYNHIDVDYYNYLNIVSDKENLDKQKIIQLNKITQRGGLLSNCEYEWLDQEKSEISNEIIDVYLKYATECKIEDDPEFMVKIADYIFHIDPVNEEGMELKCKALGFLGKHSLAKSTFENFKKEYKNIYAEDFKKDFQSVLK